MVIRLITVTRASNTDFCAVALTNNELLGILLSRFPSPPPCFERIER